MPRWLVALLVLFTSWTSGCFPDSSGQGHTILYVGALPPGSPVQFPSDSTVQQVMADVRDYYYEVSYQKYRLRGLAGSNVPGDWYGVVAANEPIVCGQEASFVAEVLSGLSVDLSKYDHVVFSAPENCGVQGGYYGGTLMVNGVLVNYVMIITQSFSDPTIIAHELGHLLGMPHSGGLRCRQMRDAGCDFGIYRDFVDVMGNPYPFGHMNAFQKELVGWLDASTIIEVTQSGTYYLTPFELRDLGAKALKIKRQDDSHIYVEYRTPTGFDDLDSPGWTDGVMVRVTRPRISGAQPANSYIVSSPSGNFAHQPGETAQDKRGNQITVVSKAPYLVELDVTLAEQAEYTPPTVSLDWTQGATPDSVVLSVDASDASGIDRVEFHEISYAQNTFDWSQVDELATFENGAGGNFQVDFEHQSSQSSHSIEVAIFDIEGNVTWRRALVHPSGVLFF